MFRYRDYYPDDYFDVTYQDTVFQLQDDLLIEDEEFDDQFRLPLQHDNYLIYPEDDQDEDYINIENHQEEYAIHFDSINWQEMSNQIYLDTSRTQSWRHIKFYEWSQIKNEARQRMQSDDKCPICLESMANSMEQLIILCCSHVFHKMCISNCEQATSQKKCPLCRKQDYQQIEYKIVEKKKIRITNQERIIQKQLADDLKLRGIILEQGITKSISTYLYLLKLRYFRIQQNNQQNGRAIPCCCC